MSIKKTIANYRIVKSSLNGETLHTALRKCCDTDMTTIAWNAIQLMEDSWDNYINWLYECLTKQCSFSPKTAVSYFIEEWSLKWEPPIRLMNNPTNILIAAFKNFSKTDWESYCTYIKSKKIK